MKSLPISMSLSSESMKHTLGVFRQTRESAFSVATCPFCDIGNGWSAAILDLESRAIARVIGTPLTENSVLVSDAESGQMELFQVLS